MGSNSKEARLRQEAYWQNKLEERVSVLNEKGLESGGIAKDRAVRQIRAEIRRTQGRLQVITGLDKKAEEMAATKAAKAAQAKQGKTKKEKKSKETAEVSKRQEKKKAKKAKKEKEKKAEE